MTYDTSYVTYTPFCIHHMSLTPHSVYIICHLHLILYTSYVTYTDVYRMRCKWHMMYTEWGVSEIWCRQNEVWHMMYTEWVCIHHMSLTPHSVYIISHLHLILYTSYVTYTSFCLHHMSLTPYSVYIICHLHMWCKWHMMYREWGVTYEVYRMWCKWHMMYREWGVGDIWCIQNEM
jgi:hypothetical protein